MGFQVAACYQGLKAWFICSRTGKQVQSLYGLAAVYEEFTKAELSAKVTG